MELTSFASGSLLSLLPGAPVSEDGQSLVQGSWGKKLIEQQTEAVCPWVYRDRSSLICTLQVTFIALKSGQNNFSLAFAEASYLFCLSEFLCPL